MNFTKLLFISILSLSISSFVHSTTIKKSNLYGSWQCDHDLGDPNKNLKINFNYTINLMKNGTSEGFATLFFSMGGLPELKYREIDKATWRLEGEQLHIQSNSIQFINESHPEFEQLLNLQQQFPKSVNESVKIVGLTKYTIKLQSKQHNDVYSCVKI